jgi:hypothetical protein
MGRRRQPQALTLANERLATARMNVRIVGLIGHCMSAPLLELAELKATEARLKIDRDRVAREAG